MLQRASTRSSQTVVYFEVALRLVLEDPGGKEERVRGLLVWHRKHERSLWLSQAKSTRVENRGWWCQIAPGGDKQSPKLGSQAASQRLFRDYTTRVENKNIASLARNDVLKDVAILEWLGVWSRRLAVDMRQEW